MLNQNLIDAQEMSKKHPKTFSVPTDKELRGIKKGDFVKICVEAAAANGKVLSERIWVEVDEVMNLFVLGQLANNPVCFHAKLGDKIKIQRKHIYAIMDPCR